MDRATLYSSRFLTLAAVAAAGLLCGCVPDYTTTYDPRIDGLSPPQVASAEPGILDDQKSRTHTAAVMPVIAKPPAPAGATPPVEGTTQPAPADVTTPPAGGQTTPPPPPDATQPAAPVPPAAAAPAETDDEHVTRTTLASVTAALNSFQTENQALPTSAQGLDALVHDPHVSKGWRQHLDLVPVDAWGHEFIYHSPGAKGPGTFDLYSAGLDGKPETADDVHLK